MRKRILRLLPLLAAIASVGLLAAQPSEAATTNLTVSLNVLPLKTAAASTVTKTFTYDVSKANQYGNIYSSTDTLRVPSGVTQMTVVADGAGGGASNCSNGGNGQEVTATFPVTQGEYIAVSVGRGGNRYTPEYGGSGGGLTAVIICAASATAQTCLPSSALGILYAGSGGGAGTCLNVGDAPASSSGGYGGDAGYPNGANGGGATGGQGATQSGGGGGQNGADPSEPQLPGGAWYWERVKNSSGTYDYYAGYGGGGMGYFGAAGGWYYTSPNYQGGGGGGGSSHVSSNATGVTYSLLSNAGVAGGDGTVSSTASTGATSPESGYGGDGGNGKVTLTFQ